MSKVEYHLTIKEMPEEERPREKMEKLGAEVLGNSELIAILLGHGFSKVSAIELANHLLKEHGSLSGVARLSFSQLKKVKGIGTAKAAQLSAAFELAKRLSASTGEALPSLKTPDQVARLLMSKYSPKKKEHFGVLILDTKNRLKKEVVVFVGSLASSLVHPREIFHEAVVESAASLILFHNHPSGDPSPSPHDISLTKRLKEAGEMMGIEVLDHLIIGHNRYVSLKEKGLI